MTHFILLFKQSKITEYKLTYSLIRATASSNLSPSSMRANATKTGALPRPATQCTATHASGDSRNRFFSNSNHTSTTSKMYINNEIQIKNIVHSFEFPYFYNNLKWSKDKIFTSFGGNVPSSNTKSITLIPSDLSSSTLYVGSQTLTTSFTLCFFSSC